MGVYRKFLIFYVYSSFVVLSFAWPCYAQEIKETEELNSTTTENKGLQVTEPIEYPGVNPDKGGEAPLLEKAKKSKINVVTWPGFQMLPGGAGSRVFVQICKGSKVGEIESPQRVAKPPFKVSPNSLVYIFPKSVVLLRNNLNPLVSKYFNSPVLNAKMKKYRKRVYLIIDLKVPANPVREEFVKYQDDLFFFFVEFEPGNFIPVSPSEASKPSSESSEK